MFDIGDNNDLVPFVANTLSENDQGIRATFDFDAVATEADSNFWTVYLLNAYQCDSRGDLDPETESANPFVALAVTDAVNGQGSTIFLEVFKEFSGYLSPVERPAYDAVHEFGHLFNADHADGGVMAPTGTPERTGVFTPITLNRIRSINHP